MNEIIKKFNIGIFFIILSLIIMYIYNIKRHYYCCESEIEMVKIMNGVYIFAIYVDYFVKEIRIMFFIYNKSVILNKSKILDFVTFNNIEISNKKLLTIDNYYYMGIVVYKHYVQENRITYLNNIIKVNNIYKSEQYENLLCVTTFINYDNKKEFLKFLKHYIYLGINMFVIYKTNCSIEIEYILNKYYLKGIITIIKDNYTHNTNLFKYGNYLHVLKHNDCYYRYKYLAKHILFVDQDELLITKRNTILNSEYNNNYDVIYYYSLLNISNEKSSNIFICPLNVWKYFIYNTKCINYIDIHRVITKQNCRNFVMNFSNEYILHNRKSYPWYYKKCKINSKYG